MVALISKLENDSQYMLCISWVGHQLRGSQTVKNDI